MRNSVLVLAVIAFIIAGGCNKLESNNTYSLKGKMLQDCSGIPLSSYNVRLKYKAPSAAFESKDLGTVTTDANGSFTISGIPIKYRDGLYLYHDVDANTLIKWCENFIVPISSDNGQVYDLGTFYGSHVVNTVVKISIDDSQFGIADTLYVGYSATNYEIIYPISNTAVKTFQKYYNVPGIALPPTNFALYWGVGKSYYDSLTSPNKPADASQHIFYSTAAICSYPDTTYFTIP